jgi:transposase
MARKSYPEEFKRDAVALYRDTDGATITMIAAELGVSEATLSAWCKAAGVPIRHRGPAAPEQAVPGGETAEQELARLRAENKALQTEQTKLATERDIALSRSRVRPSTPGARPQTAAMLALLLMRCWPSGSAWCTTRTTLAGRRGSPLSSTTVSPTTTGSTTSGWPG